MNEFSYKEEIERQRLERLRQLTGVSPPIQGSGRIARNKPCPCGSGLKFKRCCGLTAQQIVDKVREEEG